MRFRYTSFDPDLCRYTGTIIYGTCMSNNEFVCEKVLYMKGIIYNKKCILDHMNEMRNMIKNFTRTINTGDFLNFKLPFMNYSRDFIQVATTLSYPVYEIRHNDNRVVINAFFYA